MMGGPLSNSVESAMPIRRLILVPTGLILAIAASFIFLVVAGLAEPAGRKVLEGIGWLFLIAIHSDAMRGDPPGSYIVLATRIVWWATLAVVVAPILITALIGEVARLNSFIFYVCAPAILMACLPWLARNARTAGGSSIRDAAAHSLGVQVNEARLALLLFLSGALSGFIYWAVARPDHGGSAPATPPPLGAPPAPRS
jgi:hypothetical protein